MAEIRTVGVIGAGQMGNGIAHVSALAGYEVVLTDVSEAALAKGLVKRNVVSAAEARSKASSNAASCAITSGEQAIRVLASGPMRSVPGPASV